MSLRPAFRRHALAWAPAVLLVVLTLAGCARDYPQTTLAPKGDFGQIVDHLFMTTVWWATAVFVLVEGALLYAIVKFRARPGAPEPEQTHGNTTVEIIWTIIPAAILAMIAVPTVKAIFQTAKEPGPEALQVEVIGHQWWWEFRYPDLKIVTANELHVPVGQTVNLRMTTVDVIHSFWLPTFAGKRDVFPKRFNNIWFKADTTGLFSGQCAEFCGVEHGRMAFRVVSQTPEEFQAWTARQQVGSPLIDGGAVHRQRPGAGARRGDRRQRAPGGQHPGPRQSGVHGRRLHRLPCDGGHADGGPASAGGAQPDPRREPAHHRGRHAADER